MLHHVGILYQSSVNARLEQGHTSCGPVVLTSTLSSGTSTALACGLWYTRHFDAHIAGISMSSSPVFPLALKGSWLTAQEAFFSASLWWVCLQKEQLNLRDSSEK